MKINQYTDTTIADMRSGGGAICDNASAAKSRIEYVDALRGLTMILVVYSHVANLLFKTSCITNDFFVIFRMPLFFFISGFFSYSAFDRQEINRKFKKKFTGQLLPTVVCFLLFAAIYEIPLSTLLGSVYKGGYWFTLIAFECYVTFLIIKSLNLSKRNETMLIIAIVLLCQALFSYFFLTDYHPRFFRVTSFELYLSYVLYFMAGIIAKMYFDLFQRMLNNQMVLFVMLVAFLFLLVKPIYAVGAPIRSLIGALLVFKIFQYYSSVFSSRTKVGSWLSFVGKFTLEIYLLHYIILYSMSSLVDLFDKETLIDVWILQFVVYIVIAVVIVMLCLLSCKVFQTVPPMYRILFGKAK